jgi:hypothetical protein
MAGDLKANNTDWNSWQITAMGSLLYDCANRNPCLFYGPYSPTTALYTHNATATFLL